MKVDIKLPSSLFTAGIKNRPQVFNWQASFDISNPKGTANVGFATGYKSGKPSLIWETMVQSQKNDIPPMPDKFPEWLESAHTITHNWFFTLIEGELERRFSGE